MTARARDYRVRIWSEDESAVEVTLGLADMAAPPVVTGAIARPTQGATEMRPFTVELLDRAGALTAAFTDAERWRAIGRWVDVGYRDLPSGEWVTYGAGRLSALDEAGPGLFRAEVSDESWKARRGRVWEHADTTRLWPAGRRAMWDAFLAAPAASGTRASSDGALHLIKVVAGGQGKEAGRRITDGLIRWLSAQLPESPFLGPGTAGGGNFGPARLSYGGTDYEVVTFGRVPHDKDLLATLRTPLVRNEGRGSETWEAWCWVRSAAAPPASGAAYLHAPTAPPSRELPLHIGMVGHPWGTASSRIHPATLTRRVWDGMGIRYDDAALTVLEADTSLPHIAPRLTEVPEDIERWMQEHVWGPLLLMALRATDGRRRLVDLRLPQNIDPDALPVIDANNARVGSWRLAGRDAINVITYVREKRLPESAARMQGAEPDLDDLWVEQYDAPPIEGDTVAAVGRREHRVTFTAAGRSGVWADALGALGRELLDIYQDGAWTLTGEVGETLAATLAEGALAIIDAGSLKLPNPASGARTDLRLARALSITRHPTHAEVEWLDLGPKAAPLVAPSVSLEQDPADPDAVLVTVGNVPAGAMATVEVAYTDSAAAPTEWPLRRAELAAGVHTFRGAPGTGYAHARARNTAPGRIRSAWTSAFVALAARPAVLSLTASITEAGRLYLAGTLNALALGVRVLSDVHLPGVEADPAEPRDFDAATFAAGIELEDAIPVGYVGTVEVEPWSGWTGSAVSGDAGAAVSRTSPVRGIAPPDIGYPVEIDAYADAGRLYVTLVPAHASIDRVQAWVRKGASPLLAGVPTPFYRAWDAPATEPSFSRTVDDGTWHIAARGLTAGAPGPVTETTVTVAGGGTTVGPYGRVGDVAVVRDWAGGQDVHRVSWTYEAGSQAATVRVACSIDGEPWRSIGPEVNPASITFMDRPFAPCLAGVGGCYYRQFRFRVQHIGGGSLVAESIVTRYDWASGEVVAE